MNTPPGHASAARPRPRLAHVGPAQADAFVRERILTFRSAGRRQDAPARLALVRAAEIDNAESRPPDDAAWWVAPPGVLCPSDIGLSIEIAVRLLATVGVDHTVAIWTRPGPNEVAESDVRWWSALCHGAATAAVAVPPMLVITRWGWRSHPDGASRTWRRLRASA